MAKIIAFHSFRDSSGKSNIAVNLTVLMAAAGWRVGVVDADLHAPCLHTLFGVPEGEIRYSLNDYLYGRCTIGAPRLVLVVNKAPPDAVPLEIQRRVAQVCGSEVAAVLPFSEEMAALANTGVFVLHYGDHPLTKQLRQVMVHLLG